MTTPPKTWPADRVVRMAVSNLVPYARNARMHSPGQVKQLADSIRRFGFTNPVIVDERGEIIAGHGRVLAAQALRLTEVPGIVIADGEWSPEDIRIYRIWDNQSALLAEWNAVALKAEFIELKKSGCELSRTGFGEAHLVSFMSGVNDPAAEWKDMPEFAPGGSKWFRSITVHFKTAADVEAFAEKMGMAIGADTKSIFLPEPERRDLKAQQYEGAKDDEAA